MPLQPFAIAFMTVSIQEGDVQGFAHKSQTFSITDIRLILSSVFSILNNLQKQTLSSITIITVIIRY